MKRKIQQLIAKARTEDALKLLLENTVGDNALHNRAIQLSARFQTYKQNLLGNLESSAVLGVEVANINRSLLAIAEELETNSTPLPSPIPPPAPIPPKVWLKWLGIAVAVCAFLASLAELSGYSLRDIFSQKAETVVSPKDSTKDSTTHTKTPQDPKEVEVLPLPSLVKPEEAKKPPSTTAKSGSSSSSTSSTPSRGITPDLPPSKPTELKLSIKTDRSTASQQSYRAGESLKLFVQASQPCYVRALYKLADGQVILLAEDKQISEKDIPTWIEVGYGFEVSEPLGEEELHVFAQTQPFEDLKTLEKDGYRYVLNGLDKALDATRRGLKPQALHTESELKITTKPK